MDALIEAFGSYSIGSVIVLVAAFVFLYKIYRKAAQAIVEQHDTKKAQDEKIQKILDQESKYPEWRRQSIGIQEKLTDRLDNIEQSQKSVIRRLEEIEAERKRQKCNELRDRLLQAYRYYTNQDVNPRCAWSEMEASAFWDMFGDYEKNGGDGHMHTVVQPAMRALAVIQMEEQDKVTELMQSRR